MAKKKNNLLNHEENLKIMVQRYGTNSLWVEVEMHLTYDEMMNYYGKQCDDYEPLCGTCSNWVKWHKTGKADVLFERDELLNILYFRCHGRRRCEPKDGKNESRKSKKTTRTCKKSS